MAKLQVSDYALEAHALRFDEQMQDDHWVALQRLHWVNRDAAHWISLHEDSRRVILQFGRDFGLSLKFHRPNEFTEFVARLEGDA